MRKHLSVLALMARQTIGKVLALLAVMAVAETALFAWAMSQGLTRVIRDDNTCPAPVEDLFDFARIGWAYRAALALLFALLLRHFKLRFRLCDFLTGLHQIIFKLSHF